MPPPSIPLDAAEAICRSIGAELKGDLGFGAAKQTFLIDTPSEGALALKLLDASFPSERLEREVEAMQSCDHACIARMHQVSKIKIGGTTLTYILEEYLDGGSLAQRLATQGKLTSPQTRTLLFSLGEALDHLHARHLVHRDIKPDNIMFREGSDVPVLVDFGIVRNLSKDSLTHSHAAMGPGTPFYAAPEQLLNDKYQIDWRTDQFSLGVVASMCSIGTHPYALSGDGPNHVVERVFQRQGPRPQFKTEADDAQLGPLATMVQPWTVRRYRRPRELIEAWR